MENSDFRFMPILELFAKRIISKPTFYAHVRSGKITMYKLGDRSFVDKKEFEASFEKVSMS